MPPNLATVFSCQRVSVPSLELHNVNPRLYKWWFIFVVRKDKILFRKRQASAVLNVLKRIRWGNKKGGRIRNVSFPP